MLACRFRKREERILNGDHIPLFRNKKIVQATDSLNVTVKNAAAMRKRRIRSDKCRDIKFPVTKDEQIRFKSACKQADIFYKRNNGYDEKLTQTYFNTLLLRYALQHIEEIDWNRPYKDTKIYLHTKPTEREYEQIGGVYGLSTRQAISDRKLVYLLVISVLEKLERREDYSIVLP